MRRRNSRLSLKKTAKIPFHPGEFLKEELAARGITQTVFARHIGVSAAYLSDIINTRRGVSALMAVKIGKALGVQPQTWLNLQTQYDLDCIDLDSVEIREIAA